MWRCRSSVAGLTTALADDDPEVRKRAAWALAAVGSGTEKATAGLTALLADPDPDLRWAAAHALGVIGPKAVKAVPALTTVAADDGNDDVRQIAAESLKKVRAG